MLNTIPWRRSSLRPPGRKPGQARRSTFSQGGRGWVWPRIHPLAEFALLVLAISALLALGLAVSR